MSQTDLHSRRDVFPPAGGCGGLQTTRAGVRALVMEFRVHGDGSHQVRHRHVVIVIEQLPLAALPVTAAAGVARVTASLPVNTT